MPLEFLNPEESYHTRLQHAFNAVGKGKPALIILAPQSMWPRNKKEIKEAMKKTLHKFGRDRKR